ncbi:hypothetical protein [Streptomyces sp. NPDC052042]|uniref:hypothetical protein n=1 Tax=Streptomyces sp. NPDC052042 TaxID=3365683 RepID=UPI0037D4DE28
MSDVNKAAKRLREWADSSGWKPYFPGPGVTCFSDAKTVLDALAEAAADRDAALAVIGRLRAEVDHLKSVGVLGDDSFIVTTLDSAPVDALRAAKAEALRDMADRYVAEVVRVPGGPTPDGWLRAEAGRIERGAAQ